MLQCLQRLDRGSVSLSFCVLVEDNASFVDDLGADSLDIVELVMAFEEAFELEIPDEDAEKIATVKDAVSYIENKSAKK